MGTATIQPPVAVSRRTIWSELVFLTQVSRPVLWTTTALFYLMPLGHGAFVRSWKFWLGLFFILIPLGLVLYGVNDIVDADVYNPRKGTFLFGSLGRQPFCCEPFAIPCHLIDGNTRCGSPSPPTRLGGIAHRWFVP
jgi:hypothetical protein